MDNRIFEYVHWYSNWVTTGTDLEEAYSQASRNGDTPKRTILNLIQSEPELSCLLSGFQVVGLSRNRVTPEKIAAWLSRKAIEGRQFDEEISDYINKESFLAYGVVLLSGLEVMTPIDLGLYGTLTNIYQLPSKYLQLSLAESADEYALSPQHTAALIVNIDHPLMIGQPQNGGIPDVVAEKLQKLDDIINCLMLSSKSFLAVQKVATAVVPADEVPLFGPIAWDYHSHHVRQETAHLSDEEVDSLRSNILMLNHLDARHRDRIRLPIKKLNEYYSCNDLSDSAVYLRTSLESLFLDNDSGELSHRLSIRAAISMGGSVEKRLATYKTIKKAYEYGSKAVHRGRIGDKRITEIKNTLDQAADVAKAAIRTFLSSPIDDWLTLELTAGLQPDSFL